jgi:hypothetical protein
LIVFLRRHPVNSAVLGGRTIPPSSTAISEIYILACHDFSEHSRWSEFSVLRATNPISGRTRLSARATNFREPDFAMPLIHGQNISAEEIEHEICRWDAVLFARLGNAIAWASTWQSIPTLPAFTERVNVADNGIDAQWFGPMELGAAARPSLLRSGNNVFQYKKREVTEQTRGRIVSSLAAELRGAAADIERQRGQPLSSYVFFTNV